MLSQISFYHHQKNKCLGTKCIFNCAIIIIKKKQRYLYIYFSRPMINISLSRSLIILANNLLLKSLCALLMCGNKYAKPFYAIFSQLKRFFTSKTRRNNQTASIAIKCFVSINKWHCIYCKCIKIHKILLVSIL